MVRKTHFQASQINFQRFCIFWGEEQDKDLIPTFLFHEDVRHLHGK